MPSAGLLILAVLGTPLFVIIAAGALLGFSRQDIDLAVIGVEIYRLAEMPVLSAIPLFTFAGYLLGESKAPQRLVNVSESLLGHIPASLAVVTFGASSLFTAFTGASGITIIALGALLLPAMLKAGYSEQFALGSVTTSGSLGLLFAPSVPLILYGVIAQQLGLDINLSISDLFLAGILPGLLMITLLSLYSMRVYGRSRRSLPAKEKQPPTTALWQARWELPLPLLVLGGIYSGILAVSEAAAVTALYVLIVEVFILREITTNRLLKIVRESMSLVGGILLILGVSLASTNYLIDAGIPNLLFELIREHIDSKWSFLLLLNVFLLLLGMMLDIFAAIVIMVPILLPIALSYEVHPVHLGIIFLANMQLGYMTPPVGLNLFIASYRFNKPVMQVYRATLPFFFILLVCVLLITYLPFLSTGLLNK